jgi:hypothetical protein
MKEKEVANSFADQLALFLLQAMLTFPLKIDASLFRSFVRGTC